MSFSIKENYYSILGINQNATTNEIDKAFKAQALKNHPDKAKLNNQTTEEATKIFQAINTANNILKDPDRRREYDLKLIGAKVVFEDLTKVNLNVDQSSLRSRVKQNNFNEVRQIVEAAVKRNAIIWYLDNNYIFRDAARDAVQLGRERILQLFLDHGMGADTHAHMSDGSRCCETLKYFAAKVGSLPMVKLLVASEKSDSYHGDNRYRSDLSAMRVAIDGDHVEIVEAFLENGGDANGLYERFHEVTFLPEVAFQGKKSIADLLVKHGARVKDALNCNYKRFGRKKERFDDTLRDDYSGGARERQVKYRTPEEVEKWDQEKQSFIQRRDRFEKQYTGSIQILLDNSVGVHLENEHRSFSDGMQGGFLFLKGLDISGFNFIGVSINGQPITRQMLIEKRFEGADKAIVTRKDLDNIQDQKRKAELAEKIESAMKSQGRMISKEEIVNLVPLAIAAENGHIEVVKTRLVAGVSPNQSEEERRCQQDGIVASARKGFTEVVRLLAEHPKIDKKLIVEAVGAAKANGHRELADYLISLQDVNELDRDGDALIHKAVSYADIEEVQRLLKRGADINLENRDGLTPLSIIASADPSSKRHDKCLELISYLLSSGANPNHYPWDKYYRTPLWKAAKAGSAKAVALLLPVTKKGDIVEKGISGKKDDIVPWYVPLMFDSFGTKDWIQILSMLKKHGADFNAKNFNSKFNDILLHKFVRCFPSFSDIRSVMRDLAFSISGCEDRLSKNPLQKEHEELIRDTRERFDKALKELDFLLENGADPRVTLGDETPLHRLIEKKNLNFMDGAAEQVIGRFLSKGLNIDTPDAYGYTPLHNAAMTGDLNAAAYLVSKGATVNIRTKNGRTPLHLAAAGSPRTTKLLIDAGADINALDEDGLTPLAYSRQACDRNNKRYVHPSKEREEPYLQAQRELESASYRAAKVTEFANSITATPKKTRNEIEIAAAKEAAEIATKMAVQKEIGRTAARQAAAIVRQKNAEKRERTLQRVRRNNLQLVAITGVVGLLSKLFFGEKASNS